MQEERRPTTDQAPSTHGERSRRLVSANPTLTILEQHSITTARYYRNILQQRGHSTSETTRQHDSTYLHDQSGFVPGRLAPLVGVHDDLGVVAADPCGLLLRLDQTFPFGRGLVPYPQDVHAEATCTARSRA